MLMTIDMPVHCKYNVQGICMYMYTYTCTCIIHNVMYCSLVGQRSKEVVPTL